MKKNLMEIMQAYPRCKRMYHFGEERQKETFENFHTRKTIRRERVGVVDKGEIQWFVLVKGKGWKKAERTKTATRMVKVLARRS